MTAALHHHRGRAAGAEAASGADREDHAVPVALRAARLRACLRAARLARGMTQQQVAAAMGWSQSKVLRVEAGQVGVTVTDLKALLAHYGIAEPEQVQQLVDIAAAMRIRRRGPVLPAVLDAYLQLEHAARQVCSYHPMVLPGVLHTDPYTHAVTAALYSDPDTRRAARVWIDTHRQQRLAAAGPPTVFLIDEGVLRRRVGSHQVMARQLDHLTRLTGQHRHLDVRVLPLRAGLHPGLDAGAFTLLRFAALTGDLLYVDNERGTLTPCHTPAVVSRHAHIFDGLLDVAVPLDRLDSADLAPPSPRRLAVGRPTRRTLRGLHDGHQPGPIR